MVAATGSSGQNPPPPLASLAAMGILDDAIREHLELKRSHGASDDEIRRQEAEVFGQVRAEAASAPEDAGDEHTQLLAPDDAAALAEPGDEGTHLDEPAAPELDPLQPAPEDPYAVHPGESLVPDPETPPAAEAGAGTLEPTEVEPGPPSPPHNHHDEQHPALIDHDHIGGEEHPPEPVFRQRPSEPPLEPAPADDPPVGDPPLEDHENAAPADADEDVLEETPEFLQDAPEHDRLWFEQKPPRDFDFGE
jgi:hypothetical protein